MLFACLGLSAQDAKFATIKNGGRYFIMTQPHCYNGKLTPYYLSSSGEGEDNARFDVYLSSTADTANELWEATVLMDEDCDLVMLLLQNVGTELYLGTTPDNDSPYGRYQSRPVEAKIVLQSPTEKSKDISDVDESLYLIWTNNSGAVKQSEFNKGANDRYLVYTLDESKYADGLAMGQGMYYSGEENDGKYGLVYRLYDQETGLPAVLPVKERAVWKDFDDYMQTISNNIPNADNLPDGTTPGCLKNIEEVRAAINALTDFVYDWEMELQYEYEEDHDAAFWAEKLAQAQALVEACNKREYIPMRAGYWRFVSAIEGFMSKQGVEKAMSGAYSTTGAPVAAWFTLDEGTPVMENVVDENGDPVLDDEGNPEQRETGEYSGMEQIWEVTEGEDGHLYVKNLDMQLYINNATTESAAVGMTQDAKWIEFIPAGGGDMRLKVENTGYDLHTGGHASGAGTYGNIVGWNGTAASGSAWFMREVSREEIVAIWGEDFDDKAKLNAELQALIAEVEATLAKAKEIEIVIDMDSKLILSEDQISSEGSEESEGSLAGLIDGDNSTYWHSCWSGGALEFGSEEQLKHYLQFDLGDAYQNLGMTYVCRPVANDKPISFSVTACNTADGEFVEVTTIENVGTVNNTVYKFAIDLGAPYRYIRLRATDTNSGKRGYWHASEMQFYSGVSTSVNLFEKTGEAGTNLEAALAAAKEVDNATKADIKALRDAYEAFLAVYTDPTALKTLVTKADAVYVLGGVGAGIGMKNDAAAYAALGAALEAAHNVLDNLATCTKAELEAARVALQAALDAWNAVEPEKIKTGVWYRIQCPTTAFEKNGYNPVAGGGYYADETSLRGARIAVGHANSDDADLSETAMHLVPSTFWEESTVQIKGDDGLEDVDYTYTDECAQWRFIAATDTTYYIQNRATGLFMPVFQATSGQIATSYVPGTFEPAYYAGGIVNLVTAFADKDGKDRVSCIHMQIAGAVVVSWPTRADNGVNNGSSWEIVAVEDVAADYTQTVNFNISALQARDQVLPYAIDANNVEVEGDAMFLTELLGIDNESKVVAFNETKEEIPAGTPMFIYSEDGGLVKVAMVEDSFGWTVKNTEFLRGTLDNFVKAPAGAAMPNISTDDENFYGENWASFKTAKGEVPVVAGSAWLVGGENMPAFDTDNDDADFLFILDDSAVALVDAIEVVKNENGKLTVAYNLNGQRVTATVKGIVILNGKKVVIK